MLQTGLFSVFSAMTSYIVFMAYLSQTQLGTGVAVVVVVLTFQPTKGYSRASLVAQLVESACPAGDPSSIPGSGRSPGEGIGYPLQYSCLENPHGQKSLAGYSPWQDCREESQTGLSD